MATTPISGKDGKVTYGVGPTTLAITKWTYKPDPKLIDVSNTSDGRYRIPGLGDAEGSVTCHVDTAATHETGLAPGTAVTLNLYTTSAKKFGPISAIIDAPEYSSEVEGTYDATFNWKLSLGTAPVAPT